MSRLLEWVEVTPFGQKVSLVGLFLVIVGAGFYLEIADPLMKETETLERELHDLDRKLKLSAQSEPRYVQAQEIVSQWESLVLQQEERLGLEVPMSQVLWEMSNIAQETGIMLTLWKPDGRNREPLNHAATRHLQLHLEGGYHDVARFLEQTQYLSKTMGATGLTMHRVETDEGIPAIRAVVDCIGYERADQTIARIRHMSGMDKQAAHKG